MSVTSIEWTDRVWNPVTGCTKVSQGCKHCYAETVAARFWATQYPRVATTTTLVTIGDVSDTRPRRFTDVMTHAGRLGEPLSWRKPSRVFVNSMSDLFHEDVPDEFIDQVFAAMALSPEHAFQVLTKRPQRMKSYLTGAGRHLLVADAMDMPTWMPAGRRFPRVFENWPLPNVWLGVSVENQEQLARVDVLKDTPAAVHFVSAEPLLEDLGALILDGIEWVIVGGESGPGARPCDVAWVRSIVRQCAAVHVPVFVKQLGANPIWRLGNGQQFNSGSNAAESRRGAGMLNRKGGDPAEWPDDLRVRQFPLEQR